MEMLMEIISMYMVIGMATINMNIKITTMCLEKDTNIVRQTANNTNNKYKY